VNEALFAITPRDEHVVSVRIATSDEPHIGPAWVDGLSSVLAALADRESVRAIILEGDAPYFSAGASRALLVESGRRAAIPDYAARAVHAILDVPVPTIAAVAGHAIGGGLLLALWCDVAFLAEESLYGANFMRLGFTPGMGATHLIPEVFGPCLGRELLFSGRLVTGREIRDAHCPLSHAVSPRATVLERALSIAREFTDATRASLVQLEQILAARRRESFDLALQAEQAAHARLFADPATADEIERRYPSATIPARNGLT
jgi:4-carboxy-3-alkylbut-2-enoyl-[acp] decarboxylase